APGASQTLSHDDALGDDVPPAWPASSGEESAKRQTRTAAGTPRAVEAPSAIQEPVAQLLNARQSTAPTDPATPEDELA
ncbi:MAG: hypothetical protein WAU77_03295, partial [Solirubrobacteraceae bacterium]